MDEHSSFVEYILTFFNLMGKAMLYSISGLANSSQLVVLSYDITCKKRSRKVRRVLESVHHAKQYSVFEVMLCEGELRGVLAEISTYCDLSEDLLAVWRPLNGLRLVWMRDRLFPILPG